MHSEGPCVRISIAACSSWGMLLLYRHGMGFLTELDRDSVFADFPFGLLLLLITLCLRCSVCFVNKLRQFFLRSGQRMWYPIESSET